MLTNDEWVPVIAVTRHHISSNIQYWKFQFTMLLLLVTVPNSSVCTATQWPAQTQKLNKKGSRVCLEQRPQEKFWLNSPLIICGVGFYPTSLPLLSNIWKGVSIARRRNVLYAESGIRHWKILATQTWISAFFKKNLSRKLGFDTNFQLRRGKI